MSNKTIITKRKKPLDGRPLSEKNATGNRAFSILNSTLKTSKRQDPRPLCFVVIPLLIKALMKKNNAVLHALVRLLKNNGEGW